MKVFNHSLSSRLIVIALSLVVLLFMTVPASAATSSSGNGVMLAKVLPYGNTAMKISWANYSGATKYVLYKSRCNTKEKKYTPKKFKTVKSGVNAVTVKNLMPNTGYKFKVVAYSGNTKLKSSVLIHNYTAKYRNDESSIKGIKVNKSKLNLHVGKTATLKSKLSLYQGSKAIGEKHAVKLRYKSSNKSIASVSKKGVITAKSPGTCSVYSIAVNGSWAKTKVTVSKYTATLEIIGDVFSYDDASHVEYIKYTYNGDGVVKATAPDLNFKLGTLKNGDKIIMIDNGDKEKSFKGVADGIELTVRATEGKKYKAVAPSTKTIRFEVL